MYNDVLKLLDPFKNNKTLLVYDQSIGDIIGAILDTHKKYKKDYDKIFETFVGNDEKQTAENIFNYLKKNVRYVVEPDDMQTVKSPAAIIATGKSGSDCKNYALFINGVLDAYRRNYGLDFDLSFRFASYDPDDKTPQHVFSVMKINGEEIWTDPVLTYFNQKKDPYYFKDKKINMSLIALAGIGDDLLSLSNLSAPQTFTGSTTVLTPTNTSSLNQLTSLLPSFTSGSNNTFGVSDYGSLVATGGAAAAQGGLNPVADLAALQSVFNSVSKLFGSGSSNSWSDNWNKLKGLTADQQLAYYVSGVQSGKLDKGNLNQYSELFGNKADQGANPAGGRSQVSKLSTAMATAYNQLYAQIYPDDPSISQNLIDLSKTNQSNTGLLNWLLPSTTTTTGTKTAGISTFVIIGLLGAAFYMFTIKK